MGINHDIAVDYEESVPGISEHRLPLFVWAALIIFAVNVIITACVVLSPDLRVDMYGERIDAIAVTNKPSPFHEVLSVKSSAKKRHRIERLRPVLLDPAQARIYTLVNHVELQPIARLTDN